MSPDPEQRPAVLVVEDDVLIRMEAVDMMESAGFRTYEAKSADAALVVLQERPDIGLLFTDVDMPGSMNGLQLAARVSSCWPKIRIIVASGILGMKQEDLPVGSIFFPKPYPTDQIIRKVNEMMTG